MKEEHWLTYPGLIAAGLNKRSVDIKNNKSFSSLHDWRRVGPDDPTARHGDRHREGGRDQAGAALQPPVGQPAADQRRESTPAEPEAEDQPWRGSSLQGRSFVGSGKAKASREPGPEQPASVWTKESTGRYSMYGLVSCSEATREPGVN